MREQGGGRVIPISGLGGQAALAASSACHAAKWELEGYSESVSHEVPASASTSPSWNP
ncbi:hypothetical protein [Streptomyces sp. 8L]|uniref:hypothetical protein n=1 Tax=Streptomyces sp. 8L TaxID=2877242 RepID=UPI001CD4DFD2|nr:hypothetical protein [Streptomyces sp. 8L]MCA1217883.1 hypothetical protein [Streptomyces sp. 8L]